jgi:hypothetical protein
MLGEHTMQDIFGRDDTQQNWQMAAFFAHAEAQVAALEKAPEGNTGSAPGQQA